LQQYSRKISHNVNRWIIISPAFRR